MKRNIVVLAVTAASMLALAACDNFPMPEREAETDVAHPTSQPIEANPELTQPIEEVTPPATETVPPPEVPAESSETVQPESETLFY